jgi:hypothetical protein
MAMAVLSVMAVLNIAVCAHTVMGQVSYARDIWDHADRLRNGSSRVISIILHGRTIRVDDQNLPGMASITIGSSDTPYEDMIIQGDRLVIDMPTAQAIRIMRQMRAMGMAVPEHTRTHATAREQTWDRAYAMVLSDNTMRTWSIDTQGAYERRLLEWATAARAWMKEHRSVR